MVKADILGTWPDQRLGRVGIVVMRAGNTAQMNSTAISTAQNGTRQRNACEIEIPAMAQQMYCLLYTSRCV